MNVRPLVPALEACHALQWPMPLLRTVQPMQSQCAQSLTPPMPYHIHTKFANADLGSTYLCTVVCPVWRESSTFNVQLGRIFTRRDEV